MERKTRQTCIHLVWVLQNEFNLAQTSSLLPQIYFTQKEIEYLLSKVNLESDDTPCTKLLKSPKTPTTFYTEADLKSLCEAHPLNSRPQKWYVDKLAVGKNAACANATMPAEKMYIFVNGLWLPPKKAAPVERTLLGRNHT